MGAGAQPVVELGPRFHQPVPRSRSRCAGGSSITIRSRCCAEIPLASIERRARRTGAARPHQLRLPPPAGISGSGPHLGRAARRRSAAAPGGLFLGRVRAARIASRFIPAAWAFWRAITSRARPIWTFRWSASACSTARAISGSAWIATAGSRKNTSQTDVNQLPMEPAIGTNGEPVTVQIETRSGAHSRQSLADEGGPLRSAAARLERGRQCARGPRTDFAPVRRRRAHAHPPGVAAGRGRLPRAEGHGHHARRSAPERRAQRVCRARSDPQPHAGRRARFRRRPCRASRARWCSPRTRRCPPATTASTPT